jgi:tetratricopeptide (TPR) repeat protein
MEPQTKSETAAQEASNKEEAFTHLAQGKRHLLVKDYNEAVTSLASACQLLSQLYGDIANECGEAYFNYGIALLELARTESGVLGIEGEGEENQDSDEDEGEDEKEESMAESEIKHVENGKGNENESDEKEGKSSTETESNSVNEINDTKGSEGEGKDKSAEDGDDGDDISNLRLAWEMLELAKVIFRRQAEGNKQMNLKLAEVHLKLGEVGLESETYTQAIEDIKTCLEIQTENLDSHNRCIAETHYQLGMAYSLINDFDEAIAQLTLAHQLLEKRVDYLKERGKQGFTSIEQNENPFYTIEGEIAEINALLPDVKEKINDMEDFKKETKKALMAGLDANRKTGASSESGQGTSGGSFGAFPVTLQPESDARPVSDISHLVRKKRKLEQDSSEEKCSKQLCPEVPKLE